MQIEILRCEWPHPALFKIILHTASLPLTQYKSTPAYRRASARDWSGQSSRERAALAGRRGGVSHVNNGLIPRTTMRTAAPTGVKLAILVAVRYVRTVSRERSFQVAIGEQFS